jgi:hypothetical protein
LPLHGAKLADLLIEAHQIPAEVLETMKLGDFLLGLAKGGWVGECLGYGLACDSPRETKHGFVAGIMRLGAMARWLATAPGNGGDGTRPQVAQAQEILQQLGTLGLQGSEIVRHLGAPFCTYTYVQNYATKKENSSDPTL